MRSRPFSLLALATCLAAPLSAQTVLVGGEAMYPMKDIVSNAVNSKDHTTLVAAVKAAGLVETLQGRGPFTVFAPINGAFAALPAGTVESLLRPENKSALTSVLTYHVVAGRITAKDLMAAIRRGKGSATFTTANGQTLTAMLNGPMNVALRDASGGVSNISTYWGHAAPRGVSPLFVRQGTEAEYPRCVLHGSGILEVHSRQFSRVALRRDPLPG